LRTLASPRAPGAPGLKNRPSRKWAGKGKFSLWRGLRPRLGFGLSCGRQSCLQAAFQAAVSDARRIFSGVAVAMPEDRSRRNTLPQVELRSTGI
jgi:hypothetical protein